MSRSAGTGSTPFDRLTSHYDHVDLRCPSCGYEDDGGRWKAETNGSTVLYRHICPSCGSIRKRTLKLRP
jgi:uncharacterized Zn finger protein